MKTDLLQVVQQAVQSEIDALTYVKQFINEDIVSCANEILKAQGRVIVTGIGKSAIIAQKIVATFNSTGTPAIFMHAADAIHGDLGIIQDEDVVICISNSGNTPEITMLVPFLKRSGNKLIAIVGNVDSFLAREADYIINCSVPNEACPNNLAPTNSTTAQMVMGDALAALLIEMRGFTAKDFAKYHPGGVLGKRLYMKVDDLYKLNDVPEVSPEASLKEVIYVISSRRLGVTAVTVDHKLVGAITDGDLRRMLEKNDQYMHLKAQDVMTHHPQHVYPDTLAVEALDLMRKKSITNLFVVSREGNYLGVIHLHDIIREGIY
ncbi:MAG: KpsF/GutQ family sugar-phosphate isomerase [Bacteroidales bacterium]|nr:KpsF/GutQ family sugar-phosphate isomerase [Bacteroidales bacterium]